MATLWESDLRIVFAIPVVVAGIWLALRGIGSTVAGFRMPPMEAAKNLTIMRGFRGAIVGTALALVGIGWAWQIEALAVAAGVIGAGELLETSTNVAALRRQASGGRGGAAGARSKPAMG
jgi:hypothetical protein